MVPPSTAPRLGLMPPCNTVQCFFEPTYLTALSLELLDLKVTSDCAASRGRRVGGWSGLGWRPGRGVLLSEESGGVGSARSPGRAGLGVGVRGPAMGPALRCRRRRVPGVISLDLAHFVGILLWPPASSRRPVPSPWRPRAAVWGRPAGVLHAPGRPKPRQGSGRRPPAP